MMSGMGGGKRLPPPPPRDPLADFKRGAKPAAVNKEGTAPSKPGNGGAPSGSGHGQVRPPKKKKK
jgi:hypothetical protein